MKIRTLDISRSSHIQDAFALSALCADVLAAKQLRDEEIAELLAEPVLADPLCAGGMQAVVERLRLALRRQEKVMVCGDYDADGICATAIMVDALRRFGLTCGFYIPNRFREGYGLHAHTVKQAKEKDYSLLITVDNGVKAYEALAAAKQLGVDVIVTDHHEMDKEIECLQLLHSFTMGDGFEVLCGAGVALMVSRALLGNIKEHVVLACVASIADVMPLRKQTRAIVKLGIRYLKQGICQPIRQLARDRYPRWDEALIAYQIVPKLNVTGRLADMVNVNNTVRYLLLHRHEDIVRVARQIDTLNDQRKQMSKDMVEKARTLVREEYGFQLLFDDSFHEGMNGLVAGKLAEELQRPVMVAAYREGQFKGSIRSNGMLDLTDFFAECQDELDSFGGHKAAAGIGFSFDKKQFIQDYVNGRMQHIELTQENSYEVIACPLEAITMRAVSSLEALAPFGQDFEEPLFMVEAAILESKVMGKGEHLRLLLPNDIEAVYFHCAKHMAKLQAAKKLALLGNLRVQSFMGQKKVKLFVSEALSQDAIS